MSFFLLNPANYLDIHPSRHSLKSLAPSFHTLPRISYSGILPVVYSQHFLYLTLSPSWLRVLRVEHFVFPVLNTVSGTWLSLSNCWMSELMHSCFTKVHRHSILNTSEYIEYRNNMEMIWIAKNDSKSFVPEVKQGACRVAQLVKNLPAMLETPIRFLGWEVPLEKGSATHSNILGLPWWLRQ